MITAMRNCITGDEHAKNLTERGIVDAANGSLLSMYEDSPFNLRNVAVSNIDLGNPDGFQGKIYGHDVRGNKPDRDLVVCAICITQERKSLP